jgi:hypothetical protein
VGQLPFWLATFIFILAFIVAFELADKALRASWIRHVAVATLVAAITAAAVSYVFQEVFFVRLP